MVRPLVLLTAACLAVLPLRVASAQISVGAMAGASMSNVSGDLSDDTERTTTFLVGGFLRIAAIGFSVQPGLAFTRKGFNVPPQAGVTPKATYDYLQIPLVLRIGMPLGTSKRFYIGAGPAIGLKLGCRFSASSLGVSAATDCDGLDLGGGVGLKLKSTEFSGIAETGLEFGKLAIGLRADLGLNDIFEVSSGAISVTPSIKTRTISAVAAIRF